MAYFNPQRTKRQLRGVGDDTAASSDPAGVFLRSAAFIGVALGALWLFTWRKTR